MDNFHTNHTDEELARLVQSGDKEKFGFLMKRYESKLFRYGKKFLSDKDNIDDALQDVFIKTYQNINSFDANQKFSSWIYRIAHNTYVNVLKKKSRIPIDFFDFDTLIARTVVEDPIVREREQKEIKEMVDKGLEKLSPKYREIIILYYLDELSYKEISDILRVPIGTVGIRLKRAKDSMREIYQTLEPVK